MKDLNIEFLNKTLSKKMFIRKNFVPKNFYLFKFFYILAFILSINIILTQFKYNNTKEINNKKVKKLSFHEKLQNKNRLINYLRLLKNITISQNGKFTIIKNSDFPDSIKLKLSTKEKIDIFESKNFTLFEINEKNVLDSNWAWENNKDLYERIINNMPYMREGKF